MLQAPFPCVIHVDHVDFVQWSSGRPLTAPGLGASLILRPEDVDIFFIENFYYYAIVDHHGHPRCYGVDYVLG